MPETIRIFVGCAPAGLDAESQSVLEWSIRKHASLPVEITWMSKSADPASLWHAGPGGWRTDSWATPFSGFRWSVPAACDYEGRAIYLDSDFIVLADIAELWGQEFAPGRFIMSKSGSSSRICCSLWDCEAAKNVLPSLDRLRANSGQHRAMTLTLAAYAQPFAGDWNCLDGAGYDDLTDRRLKALHYTAMHSQPHLTHALPRLAAEGRKHWFKGAVRRHPRADVIALFDGLLAEAGANGYGVERYLG